MRIITLAALALALTVNAQAQTNVVINKNFQVAATHDGVNALGFRLFVDNVKVGTDIPVAQLVGGTVTTPPVQITTRGAHSIQIASYNEDWEVKSAPLNITGVKAAPNAPSLPTIIIAATVAENGALTGFKLYHNRADVPPDAVIVLELDPNIQ